MPSDNRDDYIEQTELGADAWTELARAGLTQIGIHTVDIPVAQAFTART
ncbi:hypothetical protein [Aliiruegeria lutimaris]|uniref:Uncharacterized protein n=1 Tax=Aliiruegeria lutimaris TaxID=571298 RepID=A0A1G8IM78_9RHOB|nr:hypothetical protein [Aliiruegeria lutimaris]SDI19932.1 hypothetical protein SAMN04488026_100173 [Aliiruegeria lutimaris]